MKTGFRKILLMGFFALPSLAHAELKVLNFRQFPSALETLTGIPYRETEIQTYYFANISKFPQFGNITELNASFFLTSLSYSSIFCDDLITKEQAQSASQRVVFGSVDFTKPLSQFQDPAHAKQLLTDMTTQLWARPQEADESSILLEELQDWVTANGSSDAGLRNALLGFCSTLLSVPQVWAVTP